MSTPVWLQAVLSVGCVIVPRTDTGTYDEYGNPVYADGVPYATSCFIQPVSQDELAEGRAQAAQWSVHLGADAIGRVDGFSRLEVGGSSYEVVGPPAVFVSLTNPSAHHVEVVVARGTQ